MKDKKNFELDEDDWCLIWNSLNMYRDLDTSMKERLGHGLLSDWEKETIDKLEKGKFGNPEF